MSGADGAGRPGRLTARSFDALLDAFDSDRDRAGARYAACRERLCRFFEWRGCEDPDGLADETLDRVAVRLDGGTTIQSGDPLHYVFGVARLVCLEAHKAQRRTRERLEDYGRQQTLDEPARDDLLDARVARCLEALPDDQRGLVTAYYQGEGRSRADARQAQARRMGIPMNALRIRIHRIRERLAECVRGQHGESR